MSKMKTTLIAFTTALVTAVPAGGAGAVWGIHQMEKHMYLRDTPTGRQADNWRDANLGQLIKNTVNPLVVDAVNCGAETANTKYVGDADCDGEG
jgi:hypothetical protein